MIKAVIFDFDGVLAESVDIKTRAFAFLFEKEGKDCVRKVVAYHNANSGVSRFIKFRHIYADILKRRLDEKMFKRLCAQFSGLVMNEVIKTPFVAGARPFLTRNASRYELFVASATPQKEIKEIIKRRKMSGFFKGIYGSPRDKSSIVKKIMKEGGFSPGEVAYVGDALSDYQAALKNRVNFICRSHNNQSIFKNIPLIRKIKDLTNLESILKRL
ncbi:MAG: HAD hydrolase-like protein [Candidatus Omnitrophica bacterium]|nr:HAD hydrolase-like protein [Candidatus Omnitrophota bacterium]